MDSRGVLLAAKMFFFFTFILIERNKQKTIDELYKLKNLTLVKMCNLSNKSTNKTKKKKQFL